MSLSTPVKRLISIWHRSDDQLYQDVPIKLSLTELLALFAPYEDDPFLLMVYPIKEPVSRHLSDRIGLIFDLDKYDYFLEAVAAN